MRTNKYFVYVGNIGQVHAGFNKAQAIKEYKEYKALSEANYGRAGGENVVLYCNDDAILEHFGAIEEEEEQ
jgi:hypothetical protein